MGSASNKTASICTLEKAEGTHVFAIEEYSLKKGIGIGEYVRSAVFTVGGHGWAIRFYPDGATEYPKDRVAIAVEFMSKNAEARAFFNVGVVDPATGKRRMKDGPREPILFKGLGLTYKVVKLPKLVLEKSRFIQNDRLVLECVLTVIKESQMYEVEVPPSNITEHLGKLLEAKKAADVTFIVGEERERFEAHKIVLAARSPVFEAEFYGLVKESTEQHVTIEDMQPAVFRALLHFIYKDSLPDLDDLEGDQHCEMIRHLLVAADRYAVDRLKLMCQNILAKELDQHNCSKLTDVCIDFLAASKKAEGTLSFDIKDYSDKTGIGIGEYVRSKAFTVGGHNWAIRFYPDGATEYPKDRVAIAVEFMSKNAEARAFFDVGVVDPATGKRRMKSVTREPILFKGLGLTYKVVKLSKLGLEKSRFIQNDRLDLECVLTVIKESQMYEVEVPPSNITEHLGKLLEGKEAADVTFIVGEERERLEAHKIVLAVRSPVFEAEFYGLMKESTEQHVTIEDMQPAVFRALLHFIYKDSLPDLDDLEGDQHCEMIRHLLVAADRYAVDRLKLMCQNILAKELDVETVATTLALADQHNCSKLTDVCIDFLAASKKAEGTHVFAIEEYSLKKGIGIGEYIRSKAFTVGGHNWAIRFYPDGATEYPKDRVAIAVELMSKNAEARAFFNVGVVDPATGRRRMKDGPREPILFKGLGLTYKVVKLPKLVLEKSRFIQNDRLVLECVLTVIKESQMYEVEVPPSNITEHLGKLLEGKEAADVTFIVGEERQRFEAHKIVLVARSPVFEAEFYGLVKESTEQHVTIEDMQPAVFRALLHFIYKDTLPNLDDLEGDQHCEMIRHLLVAADRYAVDRLKLMCQNILAKELDVETVATTLALADQHNCSKLTDVCIDFLASSDKMDDVVKANLKRSCPSILEDVFKKIIRFRKA